MAIYYRLRPDTRDLSFRPDQLYKYLGKCSSDGYIFLELDGKPRAVWESQFELIGERDVLEPGREVSHPAPLGEEFSWRGEQLTAVAAGARWVINRGGIGLVGPLVVAGEHWPAAAGRIQEWLDLNAEASE